MKKVLFTLGLAAIIASCGSSKTEEKSAENATETAAKVEESAAEETTGSNAESAITPVVDAYLSIKDALVNDNQEEAANAGSTLANALSEMDINSVSEDKQAEMKEIIEVAKNHGEHISESEIDHQREHFEALSKDIKDMVAMVGSDRTLYHQYCPMYNDNEGGMWLSASEEIKNPLFGAKMLKCGKVEEVINL